MEVQLPHTVPAASSAVLENTTSKGLQKYWQMHICQYGEVYYTYTTYWQTLANGDHSVIQTSALTEVVPKNVGRVNQTAPRDQAFFEMNSDVKKQKDKGYFEVGGKSDKLVLPMLAYPWDKVGHRFTFPLPANPKFDGNRAVSDGDKMWSRKGLEFGHNITAHLLGKPLDAEAAAKSAKKKGRAMPSQLSIDMDEAVVASASPKLNTLGYLSDGEIIGPHGWPLQKTSAALKAYDPETTPQLLYRIYDVVEEGMDYLERYEICRQIVEASNHPQIILAPLRILEDEEDMFAYHAECEEAGWEGIVVKNLIERVEKKVKVGKETRIEVTEVKIGYSPGQRPGNAMAKVKSFIDEEFQVVGVDEMPNGKYKGGARLHFQAPPRQDEKGNMQPGGVFKSLPMGTIPYKKELLARREELLGTWWTVRFSAYTELGIPTNNRAVCERIPEISG